ncbi:hypothetical protein DIPPA_06128 [Diplonema papillatum]|nr:hypothetical protein DIPPA_06128 [Diplonema papillatum]
MADAFDKILEWEAEQYKRGFDEGWQSGLPDAKREGMKLGADIGCLAGMRIGYIRGYVEVLNRVRPQLPTNERIERSLDAVGAILDELVVSGSVDDDAIERLEARFAALSRQLSLKPIGISTDSLVNRHKFAEPNPKSAGDLSF